MPVRYRPRIPLLLERLEDRTAPAGLFIVNTLTDSANGFLNTGSLRYCITQANQSPGNTIVFQPGLAGMMTLSGTVGLPTIAQSMTIVGPGADVLIVSGFGIPTASSVLAIKAGATVSLFGLTLVGGTAGDGGGISNAGTLTVSSCTISNNSADSDGGGIFNAGTLTVSNCTIANNSADFGDGGGIFNAGTLTVSNCTIANNSADDGAGGGGIANRGTLVVSNSTVTGNSAMPLTTGGGGGINVESGVATLHDTIDAGNSVNNGGIGPDCAGTVSGSVTIGSTTYHEGYNLIGDGTGSTGFSNGVNGDQVGSSVSPIDSLLGPLQDNGGPTPIMALLPGSPAVNTGDPNGTGLPEFDQRGPGFARVVANRADIGAYESLFQPIPASMTAFGGTPQALPSASPMPPGYKPWSPTATVTRLPGCR